MRMIVTGAASGLGAAVAAELISRNINVVRWDHNIDINMDVRAPGGQIDGPIDALINCAGVNEQAWFDEVTAGHWHRVMGTNAWGCANMAKRCLPALRESKGTILNIVSNAAHVPMRCSLAYNASKAAALMVTKQLARELAPDITVFSISPNKLAGTGMSRDIEEQVMRKRGWTAEEAAAYQKQSLLTGEETTVEALAEFIGFLLVQKRRHRHFAGCDIPYGL